MPIDLDRFERGGERYSIEDKVREFLQANDDYAYNVTEIADEVMETGWSEANVDCPLDSEIAGWVIDVTTVSSILDRLVDNGVVERRVVDTGLGARSYYRAR